MKALRVAALGLVAAVCLLAAAPAAQAEDVITPGRAVVGGPAGWLGELMSRVAGWLGWGEHDSRAVVRPPYQLRAAAWRGAILRSG
jgi:hypothetical protein